MQWVLSSSADPRRSDTVRRVIGATPDKIYSAFADAEALMQWLPPAGMSGRALEYDFREGGRYRIELRYDDEATAAGKTTDRTDVTNGRFLELLPCHRITQSVRFESGDAADRNEMTMTWSLETAPGGTTVTVTADNVPSTISKADHDAGLKSSLENLAAFAERR